MPALGCLLSLLVILLLVVLVVRSFKTEKLNASQQKEEK